MGCGGSTTTGNSATIEEKSPKRADAYAVKGGVTPLDNKAWGAEPSKCASPIKKNPTKVRPTPSRPFRRVNTFDELLTAPRGEACVSNVPQSKVDFRSISRHSRPVAQMVNAIVTGYVTLSRNVNGGPPDGGDATLRRVRLDIAPGFTLFLTAAENDALKQSEERPTKKEKKDAGKAEPGSPLAPTPLLQKILGARLHRVSIRSFRLRVIGGFRHQVLGVTLTHDESMLCVSLSTARVPVGRLHPQQATPGNLGLGSSPSGLLLGESSLGSSLLGGTGGAPSVHAKPINMSPSVLTLGSEIAEQAKQLREPRLYLMDMRTGSNLGPFMPSRPCIQERVADMVFGWREERLYSCNDEGTVQTWLLSKRRQGPSLKQKPDVPPMIACMCVKTNSDETLIATCGENSEQNSRGQVALWSVDTGDHVLSFMLHQKCVTSFDFHPNGSVIASGDQKGIILVWRTNDGTALRAILGHTLPIKNIHFYLDVNDASFSASAPPPAEAAEAAEPLDRASQHVCLTCERLLVSDEKHVRMWRFPDLSLERNSVDDPDAWKASPNGGVDRVLPLWTRTVDAAPVQYEDNDEEMSISATEDEEASTESWSDDNEYSCDDLLYKLKPSVVLKKVATRRKVTVALPIPSGYMLYCQYGPAVCKLCPCRPVHELAPQPQRHTHAPASHTANYIISSNRRGGCVVRDAFTNSVCDHGPLVCHCR